MVRGSAPLCGVFLRLFGGTAGRVHLIPSERKQKMNDTFMKTRPVLPLLVSMALPNGISMLVNSLYNIVDSLFVARISEQAMTALSLVFPVQNLVNAISIGFGIGINAQIALHLGAGDREKADISATHGMALSILPAVHRGGHRHHAGLSAPVHLGGVAGFDGRPLRHHRLPVLHRQHGRPCF